MSEQNTDNDPLVVPERDWHRKSRGQQDKELLDDFVSSVKTSRGRVHSVAVNHSR